MSVLCFREPFWKVSFSLNITTIKLIEKSENIKKNIKIEKKITGKVEFIHAYNWAPYNLQINIQVRSEK